MNGLIDQIETLLQQIILENVHQPRVQTLCKGMVSLCKILREV